MAPTNRLEKLSAFLGFLERQLGWQFNRGEFDDRFKLQKYIFFAERFGLSTKYPYNLYIFGAYSPDLARDYYSDRLTTVHPDGTTLEEIDEVAFTQFIAGREVEWLEIASTVVLLYERYQNLPDGRRKAIVGAMEEKDAEQHLVERIFDELQGKGVI